MAGIVDIYNIALTLLGSEPVTDPAEDTQGGRLCRARYGSVRDAVIRAHPWNCALYRTTLPADGRAPDWGYAHQYTLPVEPYCLRVYSLEDSRYQFKVEGRKLLTDVGAPLRVLCGVRIEPEEMDPMLAEAVGARLAWSIAYKLTTKRTKEDKAKEAFKEILRDARSADGQEGTPDVLDIDQLEASRL